MNPFFLTAFSLVLWQRRNGYNEGKRRTNNRPRGAEREDSIRRTVYVSDIDQLVSPSKAFYKPDHSLL